MLNYRFFALAVTVAMCVFAPTFSGLTFPGFTFSGLTQTDRRPQPQGAPVGEGASREDAYRANNIGVALLEQFKYKEAADQFQRALKLDPSLTLARVNLGIAFYNVPDLASALKEAK